MTVHRHDFTGAIFQGEPEDLWSKNGMLVHAIKADNNFWGVFHRLMWNATGNPRTPPLVYGPFMLKDKNPPRRLEPWIPPDLEQT